MSQPSTNQLLTQVTPTCPYSPSSWPSKISCQIHPSNILPLVIQLSMMTLFLLNPTNVPPWASSLIMIWSVLLSHFPLILILQASISLSLSCTFLVAIQSPSHVWLFATPHGLQHARLPCPSLSPGACSNSCPLSWWCHPTISSSVVPFCSCHPSFPTSRCFQWVSSSHQVAKVFSFSSSISPSNEYSGLISFRIDWLDLLAVQGTLKSLLQHHSSKASDLWYSAFFMVQLSHPLTISGKTIALTIQTFAGNVSSF